MIKTKEEYEDYRKRLYVILAPDGKNNTPMSEVWETLEALRNVARAARKMRGYAGRSVATIFFDKALDALPAWVLENEE